MSARADTVGIAGAGPFGLALAHRLAGAGRAVLLWSHDQALVTEINGQHRAQARLPGVELAPSLRATGAAKDLAAAVRLVVLAVASTQARARARELGDALDGGHMVVHAIGALAAPDDARVSEVLREETPVRRLGALAGPTLASDLVSGQVTSMVAASPFDEVTAEARRLLTCPPLLRIYRGRDLPGVELAAALADAHTVALGLADGLGVSAATRAVLVTRAMAEAARLGTAAGADSRTFYGLAGLGNLLVRSSAASAERSPDYQLGLRLARGERPGEASTEGARAAAAGLRLAARHGVRMPVLGAVLGVLRGEISPAQGAAAVADTVAAEE